MRYAVLRTPLRRTELRWLVLTLAWPVLSFVAFVHRVTFARSVRVVAVIGSYGKTTSSRAVAAVLHCDGSRRHPAHAVARLRRRHPRAVVEVGIERPGQMARFARLVRPQVVVVTTIGSEHNSRLRNLDITRNEKAAMLRALKPSGLAVLNGDDPNVRWMGSQTRAPIRTFGLAPTNDVWASDVALDWPHGTRFVVHADGETRAVRVRLLGRHLVYPVLAAITVALAEGEKLDAVLADLELLAPTPHRLEPVRLPNGAFAIYDHYKSALETVDSALDVLAEVPAERRIAILGDVEEPPGRDLDAVSAMYARLGARVANAARKAIFVHIDIGEPRSTYAAGALDAGLAPEQIAEARTVLEAIEAVTTDLRPGDVVLVKGGAQQRFDRIELALAGRTVRCDLTVCTARVSCADCSMLERGWDGVTIPSGSTALA